MQLDKNYLDLIRERSKKSRVYKKYQATGLTLAEILEDRAHKALYIHLAKEYPENILIPLAKRISENKEVKNKGAYFMRAFFGKGADKKKIKNNGQGARNRRKKQ